MKLVVNQSKQTSARAQLERSFSEHADVVYRTLATPGGTIEGAKIFVRGDLGVWGHFGGQIGNVFHNAFGVGEPGWQIGITINIPFGKTMHSNGQLIEDSNGRLLLAHKGGLGGGKFSVDAATFAGLIEKFNRVSVEVGPRRTELFPICDVSSARQMTRLADYVQQAEVIRDIRRRFKTVKLADAVGQPTSPVLTEENDEGGSYTVKGLIRFLRTHGKIQRALLRKLGHLGVRAMNSPIEGGLRPDLFIRSDDRASNGALFEIKVSTKAQSIFTAIGQLSVYGQALGNPKKFLVIPNAIQSKSIQETLQQMNIELVTLDLGSMVFSENLDLALAAM